MVMELVAIDGLDEAIIGTAVRGLSTVLVYDASIIDAILEENECSVKTANELYMYYDVDSLGDEAPIFIYFDDGLIGEFKAARRSDGTTIH